MVENLKYSPPPSPTVTPPPREDNRLSLAGEGGDEVDGCGHNTLKYLSLQNPKFDII